MCKVQMLRALVKQRLTAAAEEIFGLFERTIAEYEEELSRSKEENERQQKLLDAVFNPQLQLHRADVQPLLVVKQEVPPEQQEWSSIVVQEDPKPPHIKEEPDELWTSQEGEQLQGLEEADITKFPLTPVPVKSEEDDEEKPQSSQLHQRQTEQMKTEADGEDCEGPEPARNSDPNAQLQLDTEDKTGDSNKPDTEYSDDWEDTIEPQSGFNFLMKNYKVPVSDSRCSTGEKPFSCSVCKKSFTQNETLQTHMHIHTEEKRFSCSVCNKRFASHRQVKSHKCVGRRTSRLHQTQTDENREADTPASSLTEQIETEADGEDCGGPEPARNSDPDTHLQPDTDDKNGDCSETETDDSDDNDDRKQTRPCSTVEKPFSCSECGKTFGTNRQLKRHIRSHTAEKPFSCSVCMKSYTQRGDLQRHMGIHTGEKPFSCSVCTKSYTLRGDLQRHMRIHTGEKPFSCSVCTKSSTHRGDLLKHMRIHTGEKPFSCSVCKKSFAQSGTLQAHMRIHTGEKRFSCSVCNKRFARLRQVKTHKCVGRRSSQLHQTQTDENREAELLVSSSIEQMETEADGEDCGGPEPARNSDPDTHLQPDTDDKTGDSSKPETDDSDNSDLNT